MLHFFRIRRFKPWQLTWIVHEYEAISFKYLVIFTSSLDFISNVLCISDLSYRKLFQKQGTADEEEPEARRETILSTVAYIIFNGIFAFLIYIGFLFSSPIVSITHIFLTAYWPVITTLSLDIHIRSVRFQILINTKNRFCSQTLIYRLRGIFQPHAANTPIVIRAKTPKFSKF